MATVLIPWRGGDPQRERVRGFLIRRYQTRWEVICGEPSGPVWCKAEAVHAALKSVRSDVVAIMDADCWTDLESAFRAITVGAAEWAVPHKTVYRLTREATESLLTTNGPEGPNVGDTPHRLLPLLREPPFNHFERRPYEGVRGGGCVVAHRDTLLEVPLDPRFRGIDAGHEDEAWGIALQTLCGPCWRGNADLVHLWHPPRPRLSHRRGSVESWEMYRRYAMANGNLEQMEALVKEARDSFNANGKAVPDRAPVVLG